MVTFAPHQRGPPSPRSVAEPWSPSVAGRCANSVAANITRDGDEAVARVTFGPAFEGAPDRAHGGVVAAVFDDTMGFVLAMERTPAYTGRLSVTYRAPTPIGEGIEFRARLGERKGRKLLIRGRALLGATTIAEAEGLFIAVDIDRFTGGHRSGT